MSAMLRTPANLVITPRDQRFGRKQPLDRWWLGGDPYATALFNALSITFPRGEALFIESVRAFREGVPPKLAREIKAFVSQEAMHSREHTMFNSRIEASGYDLTELERVFEESMALTRKWPAIRNLAVTIALEHYTAILSVHMLRNTNGFADADPAQRDLWRWHSIEEIEHKGVAYDTWLHATRDWSRLRRWWVKTTMMLIVTLHFWPKRIQGMTELLAQDGLRGAGTISRLLWFLFGKPGHLRRLLVPWAAYFLPGFHPWNHDDRELIALVEDGSLAAQKQPGRSASETCDF